MAGTGVTSAEASGAPKADLSETAPPRVVTLGGGTGSFNLLTGLKHRDCRLTAVVTENGMQSFQ